MSCVVEYDTKRDGQRTGEGLCDLVKREEETGQLPQALLHFPTDQHNLTTYLEELAVQTNHSQDALPRPVPRREMQP